MGTDPRAVVADLSGALARWIDAQRCGPTGFDDVRSIEIVALDVIDHHEPALVSCAVDVSYERRTDHHHVVLAVGSAAPPPVDLADVVGVLSGAAGEAVVWDALADPAAARRVMTSIAPGLSPRVVGRRSQNPGHTTLSVDGAWEATFFHRLVEGPHPEVAMSAALAAADFGGLDAPMTVWNPGGVDKAVVRRSSGEGRRLGGLARASLEHLVGHATPPARAGRDLADDMAEIGRLTGSFHVASAAARGARPLEGRSLARQLVGQLPAEGMQAVARDRVAATYHRLEGAGDLGAEISPHGRLTLDTFVRGDGGWSLADAGRVDRIDDPARTSPLLDVATLLAGITALARDVASGLTDEDRVAGGDVVITAWETRLAEAFVSGYGSVAGVIDLLPPDPPASDALMAVFELDSLVRISFGSTDAVVSRRIAPAVLDRLMGSSADGPVDAVTV
jgi:hypothetical protein